MSGTNQPENSSNHQLLSFVQTGYDSLEIEPFGDPVTFSSSGKDLYQDDSTDTIYVISQNNIFKVKYESGNSTSETVINFDNPKSLYLSQGNVYYISKKQQWLLKISIDDFKKDTDKQSDVNANARIQRDISGNIYTLSWLESKAKFQKYKLNPPRKLLSQDKKAVLYLADNEPSTTEISSDDALSKYYFNKVEQKYYSLTKDKDKKWQPIETGNVCTVCTMFSINSETGIISTDSSWQNIYSDYSIDFQSNGDFPTGNIDPSLLIVQGNGYVSVEANFFIVNDKDKQFKKIYIKDITKKIDDFAIDGKDAYLISDSSFYIYSLPEFKFVGRYTHETPSSDFTSVAISGKYAFLTGSNYPLAVINLFNKSAPSKEKDLDAKINGTMIRFFEDTFLVLADSQLLRYKLQGTGNKIIINAAVGVGNSNPKGAFNVSGQAYIDGDLYLTNIGEAGVLKINEDGKIQIDKVEKSIEKYDGYVSPSIKIAGELLIIAGAEIKGWTVDDLKPIYRVLSKCLDPRHNWIMKILKFGGRGGDFISITRAIRVAINTAILEKSSSEEIQILRRVLQDLDSIFTNAGIAANAYGIGILKETIGLGDVKKVSLLGKATAEGSVAIGANTKAEGKGAVAIGNNTTANRQNAVVIGVGWDPNNHQAPANNNENELQPLLPGSRNAISNGVTIKANSNYPSIIVCPGQENEAGSVAIGKSAVVGGNGNQPYVINSVAIGSYTSVSHQNAVVIDCGESANKPLNSEAENTIVLGLKSSQMVIRPPANSNQKSGLIEVNASIVPHPDSSLTIGDKKYRFDGLYIKPNSLHIGTKEKEGTIGFDTTTEQLTLNAANGIITKGIQFTTDSGLCNCDPVFQRLFTDANGHLKCTVEVSRVVDLIRFTSSYETLPGKVKDLLTSNQALRKDIFSKLGIPADSDIKQLPYGKLAKAENLVKNLQTGSIKELAESLVKEGDITSLIGNTIATTAAGAATVAAATTAAGAATAAAATTAAGATAGAASGLIAGLISGGLGTSLKNQGYIPEFKFGTETPPSNTGNKGDFYIDTQTGDFYIKDAVWEKKGNLQGHPGERGSQILVGKGVPQDSLGQAGNKSHPSNTGNKGDFYIDSQTGDFYIKDAAWEKKGNLRGHPGQRGSQILVGIGVPQDSPGQVEKGTPGETNSQTLAGKEVPKDSAGKAGNQAHPSNTGNKGDFYIDSQTGDFYIKNAAWEKKGNLRGHPGERGSQILVGKGVPQGSVGKIGDFYLNSENGDYFLKTDKTWEPKGSLRGAQGSSNDPHWVKTQDGIYYASGVGIGTKNPTKAMLEINGHKSYKFNEPRYTSLSNPEAAAVQKGKQPKENPLVAQRTTEPKANLFSVYASDRIAALEFNAFCDGRIKNIQGVSDTKADLETLLQVEITDYTYKDRTARGNCPQKKVIGQQVAKVFPQAVSQHSEVVPDIMQTATVSETGEVKLSNHGLKQGERVRLIFLDKKVHEEVYDVKQADSESFKVSTNYSGEALVYGREVDDFHVVDLEALSMLNISATQEIFKIINRQNQLIEHQNQTIEELSKKVEALEKT